MKLFWKIALVLIVILCVATKSKSDIILTDFSKLEKNSKLLEQPIYPKTTLMWPYYNSYQYQNVDVNWHIFSQFEDLRIASNGQGHIDDWDFKCSFDPSIVYWRNNFSTWFERYYFDWRLNEALIPEANLSLLILLGSIFLSTKKNLQQDKKVYNKAL